MALKTYRVQKVVFDGAPPVATYHLSEVPSQEITRVLTGSEWDPLQDAFRANCLVDNDTEEPTLIVLHR